MRSDSPCQSSPLAAYTFFGRSPQPSLHLLPNNFRPSSSSQAFGSFATMSIFSRRCGSRCASLNKEVPHTVSLFGSCLIGSPCHISSQLPVIARAVGKKPIKQHLEGLLPHLVYSLQGEHQLSRAAAQDCVRNLAKLLGPTIFSGRVELYDAGLLPVFAPFMTGR